MSRSTEELISAARLDLFNEIIPHFLNYYKGFEADGLDLRIGEDVFKEDRHFFVI